MTYIYLGAHSSWYQAAIGVTITVSEENYTHCNLFKKYTHKLTKPTEGDIYIYKEYSYFTTLWKNCATLQRGIEYKTPKLEKVYVYVNRFDSTNSKLLVVFYFKNGLSTVENKYYPYSEIGPLIDRGANMPINSLCKYKEADGDKQLLEKLIEENDRLDQVLTYDIMQRPNNNNGSPCTYNCNKINVEDDTNGYSSPKLTDTEFKRYVHTPKNSNGAHKSKPACVIYNCNTLLGSDGKEEVKDVQGQQYDCIKVYFGTRAKRACADKCKAPGDKGECAGTPGEGSTCPPATSASPGASPPCTTAPGVTTECQDVPLLLALQRTNGGGDATNNNPEYYVHRRKAKNGGKNGDTYYWVKLTLDNGREGQNGLKELLSDIGMPSVLSEGNGTKVSDVLAQTANGAGGPNGQTNNLTLLLKRLEFDLTDSVVILMDKNKTNGLDGYGDGDITSAIKNLQPTENSKWINRLKLNGENKIKVTDAATGNTCLTKYKYRVVEHSFEKAVKGLGAKCHAGLRFFMPKRDNSGKYGELKLYSTGDTQTSPANLEYKYYTRNGVSNCEAKVCVYFYGKGGKTGSDIDTVPLMLQYNKQFYRPCDRDNYFTKWVCVTDLCTVDKECGCPGGGSGDCSKLANQLDKVNLALNRVDLDPDKASTDGYGLPDQVQAGGTKVDTGKFDTKRIIVKQQTGPKQPPCTTGGTYTRVIHRTKNGFQIGCITYCDKEIVDQGITPNGAGGGSNGKIPIANGGKNHQAQVNTYNWNTVVAYYSKTDTTYSLPQLIVILKTDAEVSDPVTGSANTPYGYYVLATQKGASSGSLGYEYKWVEVKEKPATGVELNDETDFSLLNAAFILLERTSTGGASGSGGTYGESEISGAVTSAIRNGSLKESPGNTGQDINRLTGKKITVTDETGTGGGAGGHKCLDGTGFKVMTHDPKELVNLGNGFKDKLPEVKLITGLRFLIPTRDGGGKYRKVKLVENGLGTGSGTIKYHQRQNGDKIYIFFYGSDPRPLLLCYNGWAYAARSMEEYNKQQWHKAEGVTKCNCTKRPSSDKCENCKLLVELVKVSDFLNPVDINIVATSPENSRYYYVHQFNGRYMEIKVTSKPASDSFCYRQYTHTHAGITGKGEGFRLGNIYHGDITSEKNCIKQSTDRLNGNNGKCISASDVGDTKTYKPSPEVVVFYYKKDNKHQHPLLVALRQLDQGTTPGQKYKPYFELKAKSDQGQPKLYKKSENGTGLDLSKTGPEGQLARTLDSILFNISQKLRVVLAARPEPRDYKPSKNGHITEAFKGQGGKSPPENDPGKQLFDVKLRMLNEMADEASKKGKPGHTIRESLMHHVLRETQYQAQLCDPESTKPVSSSPSQTAITVREVDCSTIYSQGGYRCFQHVLTDAEQIEQVGGLKLAVFDGPGGQGGQEITLCTGDDKGATNSQKIDVTYTTCKGDLYVFFYGDDPRPLMLCYDNCAYRPMSMAGYCKEWVRVNEGGSRTTTGSRCADPKSGDQNILNALYQVSVFMNPVYLCLTKEAYKTLDPQHGQSNGQQQQSEGPKQHLYTIHKKSQPPVCVRVTGIDLRCYKQYVHRPAIDGYRLGQVTYAGAVDAGSQEAGQQCSQGTAGPPGGTCSASSVPTPTPTTSTPTTSTPYCFEYDSSKQLLSVCVYYYMYDFEHKWPLVVELGFRGQSSEFYRLCNAPPNGSGSTAGNGVNGANGECKAPSGLQWVKMAHTTQKTGSPIANSSCANGPGATSTQNDQGDCGTCPPGSDTNTDAQSPEAKAETCREDAEFVEEAARLYRLAHGWERAVGAEFKAHESDLNDLIEQRAYDIRKSLKLDYGEKTKDHLILATDKNCYEDSIMAYVVCLSMQKNDLK